MRRTETVCPWCGTGCAIRLIHDGGRVIGSEPVDGHPASRGGLCAKGWSAHAFINHPDRLTTPLIRRGERLLPATWDEAIDVVVSRFLEIRQRHGADSLMFLSSAKGTNEENYLLMKLARGVFGTNNVDHCARLCHSSSVAALVQTLGSGAMTSPVDDIDHSDLLFVIGSNTTEQHPLIGGRIIRRVTSGGARLIVADPRSIPLARHATLHLLHRPGSDTALILGMIRTIVDEGVQNRRFIGERTEGYDDFVRSLEGWTPERAAELTGIPPEEIRTAARLFARAESAMILYAMGITQHSHGVDNVRALSSLALLTGNVGRPGAGICPLRGQNNVQGSCDMGCLPDLLTGYQPVADPAVRQKFADAWGVASLPERPGLPLTRAIDAALDGEIRGMLVTGENPLLTDPDSTRTRRALERLQTLVVIDIFPTETAQVAHVVLPAACFAEKEGSVTSTERRVQLLRKVVEPPGTARGEREIFALIARRAGHGGMEYPDAASVMEEIRRLTPIYGGITHERLREGGIQWPCPDGGHPGTPRLHTERFTRGRGRFVPVTYRPPAEGPDSDYPLLLTTGRVAPQWHGGSMTRRAPLLEREEPSPFVEINPADAVRVGITDRRRVTVTSRRGSITLTARVTDRVREGVIFIPFHYVEAAANILTSDALDPESAIPEYKVAAVSIGRAP